MIDDAARDTRAPGTSRGDSTPGPGFTAGLIAGGIIGVIFGLAFAPRAGADLRRKVVVTARDLGASAAEQYQSASARVGEAVGHLSDAARTARDDAAETVAGGAREVARLAISVKS